MIDLPAHPAPSSAEVALVDFGATLTPSLGGPVQRVERMGSRWRISCSYPPMKGAKIGRQWISALVRAKQVGGRMPVPLQGFDPGVPGSPTVNGVGQSGRTLAITGARANYVVRDGQWINHVTASGQHYLYMNIGETILNASGAGTLTIEPMLRVSPAAGAMVKLAGVMIEGFAGGEEWGWSLSLADFVGFSFDLTERG